MMQDEVIGGVFISVGCSFGSWECVDVPGMVDPSKPERHNTTLGAKGLLGTLIGYNDKFLSYKILSDDGCIVNTKHLSFLELQNSNTSSFDDEDITILNEDVVDLSPEATESNAETPEEISKYVSEEEESSVDKEVTASLAPNPTCTLRDQTSKVKPTKIHT
ncbi:hypothetical protein VP01_2890g4 [Puccinia sorghi]|uniref:Uncharacterized protein n=1 Tax=Puccinia sorghi TaxID=27349 RepID=A0A0L6V3G6_9BASI|nr:hypothetical protein VP01_2890g4 [Puccinia sorghi]